VLRSFTAADAKRVQELAGERDIASATLAVTLKPSGLVVGSVALFVEKEHHRAELGYLIAKEHWNHGHCTEAAQALLSFGFRNLDLNRIQAMHVPRNPGSGRVMEKLGMTKEGVLRQYVLNRGVFEDLVLYSILRPEFDAAGKAG
jgi:RimJ/RimL family protein N-acetyltransferase